MRESHGGGRLSAALIGAFLVAALAAPAGAAGVIALPRTGQTTSYSTGDDGDLEVGVAWPSPRFTGNGDGTITDELTGLVWLGHANCADAVAYDPDATGDGRLSWDNAGNFVTAVNTGAQDISACGYSGSDTDWRVANVLEIESLMHAGLDDQSAWLSGQGFTQVQLGQYWTSTTSPGNDTYAYSFRTNNGRIGVTLKTGKLWVWLVRAGANGAPDPTVPANLWKPYPGVVGHGVAWPVPRLVDNGDGTVTDFLTGLMWLKDVGCLGTTSQWQTALDTIADFNLQTPSGSYTCQDYDPGTHDDWRMPNRKELWSLIDHGEKTPSLPSGHPFTNIGSFIAYAVSTTVAGATGSYWQVSTYIAANIQPQSKDTGTHGIWPVRTPDADAVPALSRWWQVVLAASLLAAAAVWLMRSRWSRVT